MKRFFQFVSHILLILHSVFFLSACEHKELCYMHPHFVTVRVEFDWSNIVGYSKPEGMRVVFYPVKGGERWIFDFPGGKGGFVEVPEADYHVMSFNYDTEAISWKNEDDYFTFMADTRDVAAPDKALVCLTPDYLCGDHIDMLRLEKFELGTETVVSIFPKTMVCRYTYEVNGIKNLEQVSDICVCLSGMSGALYMAADELPINLSESLMFGGAVSGKQIKGGFYTFGCCREKEKSNIFNIYIKSYSGGVYVLKKNVTEQIDKISVGGHLRDVHLVVNLDDEIPDKPVGGDDGGFDVGVNEWGDVNVDVIF